MRVYRLVLIASLFVAALIVAGAPGTYGREIDNAKITCGAFLASGRDNMAAIIMWLRGYHAGKTGVIPHQSPDAYGGRLGFYCRQHPEVRVIDASEQILSDIDRRI